MLTLDQLKEHLKVAGTAEDDLLAGYLLAALGAFRKESGRRWPVEGEPALSLVTDPTTDPPTTVFAGYVDPAVLTADEQAIASQWLKLTLGHWYENRQTVAVGLNVTEVPKTADYLMDLVRDVTI